MILCLMSNFSCTFKFIGTFRQQLTWYRCIKLSLAESNCSHIVGIEQYKICSQLSLENVNQTFLKDMLQGHTGEQRYICFWLTVMTFSEAILPNFAKYTVSSAIKGTLSI